MTVYYGEPCHVESGLLICDRPTPKTIVGMVYRQSYSLRIMDCVNLSAGLAIDEVTTALERYRDTPYPSTLDQECLEAFRACVRQLGVFVKENRASQAARSAHETAQVALAKWEARRA